MSDELHVWTNADLKSAEDSMLRVAFERGRRAERERIRQRIEALIEAEPSWLDPAFRYKLRRSLEALGGGDE